MLDHNLDIGTHKLESSSVSRRSNAAGHHPQGRVGTQYTIERVRMQRRSGAVEVGNVGTLVVAQIDRSEVVGKLLRQQPVERTQTPRACNDSW